MTSDRRLRILGLVVLLVFGAAWGRAAMLTTVQASDLTDKLADGRQPVTIAAPRGMITDRRGVSLAISEQASDVSANPLLIKQPARVADQVAPLIGKSPEDVLRLLSAPGGFVWLARQVPEEKAKQLRALGIEGIDLAPRTRRSYPQETVAAQMIGFAGTDGEGLAGLELSLESVLRGRDGQRLLVRGRGEGKDSRIVYVRDEVEALPGKSVKLTLDARIQSRAEEVIADAAIKYKARSATAVVMQPSTGAVLAAASWPKVDANAVADAPPEARKIQPTAFTYEPGSTFKPFTVAGALEEREITPNSTFQLPAVLQVADRTIKESHDGAFGTATVGDILAKSSNVGTVKIAQRLQPERFDKWVRNFGFGKPTGVELPGEERGQVLGVDDYSGASIGNLPIGQGLSVTPLQLATGYATIANGGIRRQPTVVDEIDGKPNSAAPSRRVLSSATSRDLLRMLEGTVAAGGTGSALAIPGFKIAGKSGTAEKFDPELGTYSKTKYSASFIGIAPADNPKVVVAVIVDEPNPAIGIYGAEVAGPAFQQLTKSTLNTLGITPR